MRPAHRIAAASGLAAVALSGVAVAADPPGFQGLFNARGTIDELEIENDDLKLEIETEKPIDVAIVGAQLHPGGETGWHIHPTESIATVQPGAPTLKLVTQRHGECVEKLITAGQAFLHPAGPHNLVNTEAGRPLNFGVAYFVPVGATLLTPVPAPGACR